MRAIAMTFLSFSRARRSGGRLPGRAVHVRRRATTPTGAVSILEKLDALQKTQPGAVARVFATHPMDAPRIDKTEQEIQKILPAKTEYVVTPRSTTTCASA